MFQLPNHRGKKTSKNRFRGRTEEACPGTPLFRKKLDKGILGEANDDGSIYIDKSVKPNSKEEREILSHEMKHSTDMKLGKLKYSDDSISYDGTTYERKQGHILYNGEWIPEGGKEFPWEQH